MSRAFQIAKKMYRSHAYMYPALFNFQQRQSAVVRSRLKFVHDPDYHILSKLRLPDFPLVIDVGANFGQSMGSIQAVLGHPRIVAFEPNPLALSKIAPQFRADKNITIFNYALGSESSTIDFFVPVCRGVCFDQLAAIIDRTPDEVAEILVEQGFPWAKTSRITFKKITVQMRELDRFDLEPHVIKIDVEGAEYHVIQGGLDTIDKFRPALLVESGERPEIVAELHSRGYSRYLFKDGAIIPAGSQASLNSIFLTQDHF